MHVLLCLSLRIPTKKFLHKTIPISNINILLQLWDRTQPEAVQVPQNPQEKGSIPGGKIKLNNYYWHKTKLDGNQNLIAKC